MGELAKALKHRGAEVNRHGVGLRFSGFPGDTRTNALADGSLNIELSGPELLMEMRFHVLFWMLAAAGIIGASAIAFQERQIGSAVGFVAAALLFMALLTGGLAWLRLRTIVSGVIRRADL